MSTGAIHQNEPELDHHWHPVPFLHPTSPKGIQNWNSNTAALLWPSSKNILAQRRLLRPGYGKIWGLPRGMLPAPSDGDRLQHQISSPLLPLHVLRLSHHAETSPQRLNIVETTTRADRPSRKAKWTFESFGWVKTRKLSFSPTHMTIEIASSQQEATFIWRDFRRAFI